MANQKLGNPFTDLGTHVFGDRFVGRKKELKKLQDNCASRNISIQGLPKIGKTSLAYQGIIHNWDKVAHSRTICPVFFNVGTCTSADVFFTRLVRSIKMGLIDHLPNKSQVIDRLFDIVKAENFDRASIESFFEQGIVMLPVDIVILFDEFDKVKTIQFSGNDFSLLRAILSVSNVHGTITSKQSIFSLENWDTDHNSGPSTFYQLFQGNTIHLNQYSLEDIEEYWKRLEPYFEAIGLPLDDNYKNTALYYAGRHPHLLDVYNAHIYDHYSACGRMPDEVSIRTTMKSAFRSMISILEKEGLLKPAIQVILGPVYDLDEDELDKLVEYDFLQKTEAERKLSLLGSSYGYFFHPEDEPAKECAYLAPSDYFSLLFRRQYTNKVDFWDEWTSTIQTMHLLAQRFFQDNWGEEWEDQAEPVKVISEMKHYRAKDSAAGITCSPLLEYLTENLLRDLFDTYWDSFSPVFGGFQRNDFFDRFAYILKIRNHHAHINARFLTEEERDKANGYLKEFKKAIDGWFAGSPAPLTIVGTPQPSTPASSPDAPTPAPAKRRKFVKAGDVEIGTLVEPPYGSTEKFRVECGLPFTLPIRNVDLSDFYEGDKVRFLILEFDGQPRRFYATNLELIED